MPGRCRFVARLLAPRLTVGWTWLTRPPAYLGWLQRSVFGPRFLRICLSRWRRERGARAWRLIKVAGRERSEAVDTSWERSGGDECCGEEGENISSGELIFRFSCTGVAALSGAAGPDCICNARQHHQPLFGALAWARVAWHSTWRWDRQFLMGDLV